MSKTLVTGGLAVAALGVGAWAALTASSIDMDALEQADRELTSRLDALEERETEVEAAADSLRQRLARSEEAAEGLRAQVRSLDADSLHTRVALVETPREVAPIVDQLNGLLDRLDDSFARERRFTGNVAHELRTPIAELRTLAEVGKKWPEDTASVVGFFEDVNDVAGRMETVIADLLLLARCEAGVERVERTPTATYLHLRADMLIEMKGETWDDALRGEISMGYRVEGYAKVDQRTGLPVELDTRVTSENNAVTAGQTYHQRTMMTLRGTAGREQK